MQATKQCINNHENNYINNFCNKCGEKFDYHDKFEFGTLSNEISIKLRSISKPVSGIWLINENSLAYCMDNKYYLLRFSDYKNEPLKNHPIWQFGNSILPQSTATDLFLQKENKITAVSKRIFDNNDIINEFGSESVQSNYIGSSSELPHVNAKIIGSGSDLFAIEKNLAVGLVDNEGASFEFDFPLQDIVSDKSVALGKNGAKLSLLNLATKEKSEFTHGFSIKKVILSSDDIIFIDEKGDVYYSNKSNIARSIKKMPQLKNIVDIYTSAESLIAVAYTSLSIVDLNSTETSKKITGNFQENNLWLFDSFIFAVEKPAHMPTISICVYNMKKRLLNRHDFDGVSIKEIFFITESLSKLLINFRGNDEKIYIAMVEC